MPDAMGLRPIPGFPGYHVTRDARVWSTKYVNGKGGRRRNDWLVQRVHPKTGHLRVDLRGPDNKKHTIQVHRLVAWTFIGPQPKGMLVCHINGIETDNVPENLYYGTVSDNAQDRERHKANAASTMQVWEPPELEDTAYMRDDRNVVYVPDAELCF